ncbi:MAG: hypothetical protein KJ058_15560 [Thermoanaerobaculia bacterium]|nr:hypothetical protein [Thermoanaerobaculia bacterium]
MDRTISKHRWLRHRIAGAAVLLGLSGVACGNAEPVSRSFSYRHSADEEVLTATYLGGPLVRVTSHHLFGDGTLRIVISTPPPESRAYESYTLQIAEGRIDHLLGLAVHSGLLDVDLQSVLSGLALQGRRAPRPDDDSTFVLTVRLWSYTGPSNPVGGEVERRTSLYETRSMARAFPDIPEIAGIHAIAMELAELRREAMAKGPSEEP